MKKLCLLFLSFAAFNLAALAQPLSTGVLGQTYTNTEFRFQVMFPENWVIASEDFDKVVKSQGLDITLKAPEAIDKTSKIQVERALEKVEVLLSAFRSTPGASDNAIIRISTEDVRLNPLIRDAVDYFDLMRSQFAVMKLPPDLKYSETNAEALGVKQFAFLDVESASGKKRMYATVRGGVVIMFTLSYTKPDDLKTLRSILTNGNFDLKN